MSNMKDLASIFGLELGEEFKIKGKKEPYMFLTDGLKFYNGFDWVDSEINIIDFFKGNLEIRKIPKIYSTYYYVDINSINEAGWANNAIDIALHEQGNCFLTKEDAIENAEKIRYHINNY